MRATLAEPRHASPTLGNAPGRNLFDRPYWVALVCIATAALALRIWLALLPFVSLVRHITPDDAFYYFGIARNVSRGNGVSFDGQVVSNGFHPLWMLTVIVSYALPVSDATALRIALCSSAVVAALGCIPLAYLATKMTQRRSFGFVVAAAYALSPAAAMFSVNGLETGFLLTSFIVAAERFHELLRRGDRISVITFGIAGGILILSRTDYALVLAVMLVVAALTGRASGAIRSGGIALLLTLPWFAWEFLSTGTLLQSSAQAVPIVAHGNGPQGWAAIPHGLSLWRDEWTVRAPHDYFFAGLPRVPQTVGLVMIFVAFIFAVIPRTVARGRDVLLTLATGLVLLSFVHAGVRWYMREWYLPTLIPLAILATATACSTVRAEGLRRIALAASIASGLVVFVAAANDERLHPRYATQTDIVSAAAWVNANTEPNDVVASINAGIVGYFGDRQTVNLDGVVDGDALAAVRNHKMLDYMDRRCVKYLAEWQFYVFWYDRYWGGSVSQRLALVASFSSERRSQPPAIASDFSVWRYRGEEARCDGNAMNER